MYNKAKSKGLDPQGKDYDSSGADFARSTNINESRPLKRFSQQHLDDIKINTFAEKIPIHHRNHQKALTPTSTYSTGHHHSQQYHEEEEIGPFPVRENSASGQGQAKLKSVKMTAILPGDRVIFSENPSIPGVPVVYRTLEERASNPDRLNLDRRKLTMCPILEGEEQLRLLNYQHNLITHMQNLSSLKRLIFLDLYDNHIEEITGLSSLRSLRVLMLGKNRIKKIENLDSLIKLDVLDLHGNQITKIENLRHLTELRVLNLAGNNIGYVDELAGLDSLAELNLRRNRIRAVTEIDLLPNLQRLFLSFNDITSFEDVQCLGESSSLSEISFDGNPIAQDGNYKQIILRHMHQIKLLDMKRVTEDERRQALVLVKKDEEKRREMNKIAMLKEKRRLAINNAKRQWETMQGSMMSRTSRLAKLNGSMPELFASHLGSIPSMDVSGSTTADPDGLDIESLTSGELGSRPGSAHSNLFEASHESSRNTNVKRFQPRDTNKESNSNQNTIIEEGLNMLELIEGDTLSLYGIQSLDAFERNWGYQSAGAVNTIVFKFIDFDAIVKYLPKIRVRFPATQSLVFCSTNIHSLQQINALSLVRRLDNLTIDLDGNPVTKFTLWRMYTVFRLAQFALKKINDIEVSSADIVNAEKLFGLLSQMASNMPQYRLHVLTAEAQRKITSENKKVNETGKGNLDKSHMEMIGRAGLVYTVTDAKQELEAKKKFAHNFVSEISKESLFNERKRTELLKIWPYIITEMVQNVLSDLKSMETYMKCSLEEVERS
nr:leucine-rich repeat-containing protein 49-like [Biomphalaria glabrata]